jgi:uncharacterized protein DUF4325
VVIRILEVVGPHAVAGEDGDRVYALLQAAIARGERVQLDFSGVNVVASPFLNPAVGQLMKDHELAEVANMLEIVGLVEHGQRALERVLENSRRFYSDDQYRQSLVNILRGEDVETA